MGLFVLATAIIGWLSFDKTEKAVISSALNTMHDDLEHVSHTATLFHDRARNAMGFALENPVFKEYFSLTESRQGNHFDDRGILQLTHEQQEIRKRLIRWSFSLQNRFPIVETCLIDRTGQEHIRLVRGLETPVAELSPSEKETPFFERSIRLSPGEVYLSDPYVSPDANEWVFAYTSPIVLDDGSIPGFYHMEIPVVYFREFITGALKVVDNSTENPDTISNRLFIVTPEGLIIVDSARKIDLSLKPGKSVDDPGELSDYLPNISTISKNLDFLALMERAKKGEDDNGFFTSDGHVYFASFKPLLFINGNIVRIKSYDNLLKGEISLSNIRNMIILISIGILTIGFLAMWMISNWITQPLKQLSKAMLDLENGRKCGDITVTTKDELGDIVRLFNHMSQEVQNHQTFLTEERNKLTTIIHSTKEGVVVADGTDTVVLVNPAAERLLDKTMAEICQGGFFNLVDNPDYVQGFFSRSDESDMPETIVFRNRILNFYASKFMDQEGKKIGSAALMRDITREKNLEEELRSLSYNDKLTGLYNRRWMEEFIKNEFGRVVRYGMSLSILFFDVDHFKKFNDSYGHDMGDLVLATISKTMIANFRQTDYSCRFGGEEFCVILTNTGPDNAFVVAEKFRKKIENTDIQSMRVTVSIGVSAYPQAQAKSAEELIKLADNALYAAKKGGRNRVVRWDQIE